MRVSEQMALIQVKDQDGILAILIDFWKNIIVILFKKV